MTAIVLALIALLQIPSVVPAGDPELSARERLPVPGITARAGLASPTRSPWIVANGFRFLRQPNGKFAYELPAGKAALAAAEAFAYKANAVLRIDPADSNDLNAMTSFLRGLPAADLPAVADFGIVDDGSSVTGEVLNLLARRNLLYQIVPAPSSRFPFTIAIGSPEFPRAEAADPSTFALKIRRQLTDERRTLRIYGTEVVIARLTGDGTRARLHLINYGGREIEGLRVRLRGAYRRGEGHVAGTGRVDLQDLAVADGFTEFSVPKLGIYAVLDVQS